jgi:hypothetical protein
MTQNLNVLIVDDDPSRSAGWESAIKAFGFEGLTVRAVRLDETKELMKVANNRRIQMRPGSSSAACEPCILDSTDLLIVDYDLQELLEVGQWATGLQVATLARAFTQVKYIALINQFGTNTFDLTLSKARDSRADQDVGSDQLLNPGLWVRNDAAGNFLPWHWQDGLLRAPGRIAATQEWVRARLDYPVLETLGFGFEPTSESPETYIPKELWQELVDNPSASFRELAKRSDFLPIRDSEYLDQHDEYCSRIATAVLSHWMERILIPSGEVLIDIPHLVSSYPWLLRDVKDVDQWNSTTGENDQALEALNPLVKDAVFSPGFPLSRPALWRRKVTADSRLSEPADFSYDDFPDLVFCEDTSSFHPFEISRSFVSRLPGTDNQRFVIDPSKLGDDSSTFAQVTYEPSVFFAL